MSEFITIGILRGGHRRQFYVCQTGISNARLAREKSILIKSPPRASQ